MYKKVFLIGFLLLLLGAANAVRLTGDFSLQTDCAAPDSTTYTLYNDSSGTHTYSIRAIGENKEWANLNGVWIGSNPLRVTLRSGESEELYAFVKPQSCYVTPGDYTITIEVSNGETITKEIDVEVLESRVLGLEINPGKVSVAQCVSAVFDVEIRNNGERSERAVLELEGLPSGWASLPITETFIASHETRTIKLEVQPSCSSPVKEYPFSITASLQGTTFSTRETAVLEIEDRQDIDISSGEMKACIERISQSQITLRNSGLREDSLRLSVEGLDWVTINPSQVILGEDDEAEVSIIFSKTAAVPGSYEFVLRAQSTKFDKVTEETMEVELSDCYNVSISSVKLNGGEIEEIPAVCIESSPVYTFTLENDAFDDVEADIRVTGVDSVISPATLDLKSGESKELKVEIDLKNENPGEKLFSVQIRGDSFSLQKSYQFTAVDCFGLDVDWDGLEQTIELDANCKSEPFTVSVENQGTESQEFTVSVNGPEWIYYEPMEVEIGAGEEKEAYFFFAPPYDTKEGKHNAVVSVQGKERSYSKQIEMVVYGGLYAVLRTASVEAKVEVDEVVENVERTVKLTLDISNDSENLIRVNSITTRDYNSTVKFNAQALESGESVEVPMELNIGSSDRNTFTVTLEIDTDRGMLFREIEFSLVEEDEEEEEPEIIPVGLFGLAGLGDLLLAAIVIAVIAIFAAIALSAEVKVKGKESGMVHLAKEVQEIPGQKLEQIGKRKGKKSKKPISKNLHDIVREVKKKHVSKKKAVKKASKKKKK